MSNHSSNYSSSSHHVPPQKSSSSSSKSKKHGSKPIYYDPSGTHERISQAPTRKKLTGADKALLNTHTWSDLSDLKLEHHVVVADARQGALQGVVAFVGQVHFQKGLWVGIQLTGPSLGKGYNDGAVQGTRYFSSVGKRNGVFSHITGIQRRIEETVESTKKTPEAQFAQMKYIESLKADREQMLLKEASESKKLFKKDDAIHIKRLKEQSLAELRMSRSEPLEGDLLTIDGPKPKYNVKKKDADTTKLCEADFDFMRGLQDSKQNFLLTDPTLPDNPITFASQSFLNMTQYSLNDVVGRNCRFLQGKNTSKRSIAKIRLAIDEGSDVSIRMVNYKKDGTAFWNEFFLTALRDTRGRIKSYVGVLVEISEQVNAMKNEVATFLDSCSPALQTLSTTPTTGQGDEQQELRPPSRSSSSKKEKKKKKDKKKKSKDALHHFTEQQRYNQEQQRIMRQHPDERYIQQQYQPQPQPHHPDQRYIMQQQCQQQQQQQQPHPNNERHFHEQHEHLRRQHEERHYHEQQEQLHRAMANASLQASPRSAFSGGIQPQPGPMMMQRPVALRPQCVVSNSNHQHLYPQHHQQHPQQQQQPGFYKCLPEREKSSHSRKSQGSSDPRNWSKLMSQHSVSGSLDDTLDTTEADSSLCYTLSDEEDDEDESYGSIGYCY